VHDQNEIFDVVPDHERQLEAEIIRVFDARPGRTDPSPRTPRGMFGEPPWYPGKCDAISKAVWRGQLTDAEATAELEFWHAVLMLEMTRDKLWRKPRRGTGSSLRRGRPPRYRGWTCSACGGPVGIYSGICASCHFDGWWWS
jgi:hypothetical protein